MICLRPIKIAAGLVALAEEVVNEPLGALIQVLEVGGELDVNVSAEMRRWSDTDLRCSIGEEENHLTRGEDGAVEECQRNPRRHASC